MFTSMEIIIGRDQQTRQLCIIKDGSARLYGRPASVPMDVSRHHISLQLQSLPLQDFVQIGTAQMDKK
jgi:hypothetical protein